MSVLSQNLTDRLRDKRLKVADVVDELNRRGFNLAYSTVAAWFNGGRKPRKMEHLKALCEVLETSISEMAGEDPEFAQNAFESVLLQEGRRLAPAQREAILATIKSMGQR